MRKSRFTDEQIVAILPEAERGGPSGEVIRRHGISRETFYRWRKKYAGMQVSETKRLRALEGGEPAAEARGRGSGAQPAGVEGRAGKSVVTMEQRRTIVGAVRPTAGGSERLACRWLGFHRSVVRYVSADHRDDAALRTRLRTLADDHPRWGAPMLLWKLRQEGWRDNHKRVRRLYRLEGLAVRRRRRKRVAVARVAVPGATQPNAHWAMDFVRDTRSDGRAFRALTLVDVYTRECPVIEVDVSLGGARVVIVLDRLRHERGLPERITVDNGPEFRSKALDAWAHQHGVQLQFSRPGKPVDNTFIEAFNGRLRDECLNQHWFLSLADAQRTIERWRVAYTTRRGRIAASRVEPPRSVPRRS